MSLAVADFYDGTVAEASVEPAAYPSARPFHPSIRHPEYPFGTKSVGDEPNPVYEGVRSLWRSLDWDGGQFGTPSWNPLGRLVRPGDFVLIKPNLIAHENSARPGAWEEVITHPSVVRAVVDYVIVALRGNGRVVIADGPQTDSDFPTLIERSGLQSVVDHYRAEGLDVSLLDLRRDLWITDGEVTRERKTLPGDPLGYVAVDLGRSSAFSDYRLNGHFYGADYDVSETASFHGEDRHSYVLCRSAMEADVLVNLPKLKTHKKTGVTLSLKNLVGVNGYRNCLPHYTIGGSDENGDEFPAGGARRGFESRAVRAFKRALTAQGGVGGPFASFVKRTGRRIFGDTASVIRSGNWEGNDTAWRMVLDLNRAVLCHGPDGRPLERSRRYLSVVDGVIGGEGNGPAAPEPVALGLLLAGTNPWAVDRVAVAWMGYRANRIPVISVPERQPACYRWLLPESAPRTTGSVAPNPRSRVFVPHFGWPSVAATGRAETGDDL